MLASLFLFGCADRADVAVRREFLGYDKVAIWPRYENAEGGLYRQHEELFLPLYMKAFPEHQIVERRDMQVLLGEQDILPERLDPELRAKARRIFGVKAFVFPNYTFDARQFAIKVVDTETGYITASLLVSRSADDKDSVNNVAEKLIRKAMRELSEAARSGDPPAK